MSKDKEKNKKALRKLGLRLRRASEKFLAELGHKDEITQQLDFTVADSQSLVAALSFEKAYFVRLSILFGKLANEDVKDDMVNAQIEGSEHGVNAAEQVFKEWGVNRKNEKPA